VGSSSRLGFGLAEGEIVVYRYDLSRSCHRYGRSYFLEISTLEYEQDFSEKLPRLVFIVPSFLLLICVPYIKHLDNNPHNPKSQNRSGRRKEA